MIIIWHLFEAIQLILCNGLVKNLVGLRQISVTCVTDCSVQWRTQEFCLGRGFNKFG